MTSTWTIGERTLDTGGRPLVMGVLNVTPDSFSDGGRFLEPDAAVAQARSMISTGADLLDVGGESTRPGADDIPDDEQIRRVVPVIRAIAAESDVPVSIDTRSAVVARAAVEAGAVIVNDVSALRHDPEMPASCAAMSCGVVLMHMRGTPHDMRERTGYDDVLAEVVSELREALDAAVAAGIARDRIAVDPGIGFAKTSAQSYALVAGLDALAVLERPVLLGVSRKSFLGEVLDVPPEKRTMGTAAAVTAGVLAGAGILRVHDVAEMAQVVAVATAIRDARKGAN